MNWKTAKPDDDQPGTTAETAGGASSNTAGIVGQQVAEKAVAARTINVSGDFNIGSAQVAPQLNPPAAPKLTPPRNLPPRDPKFVGRRTELTKIHALLNGGTEVGVTQQAGTHGYGGVGKSSVAVEYAWEHLEHYPGGLFFIPCETDVLLPQIAGLAQHLGLPESEKPEQTATRVKAMLEAGPPALLILDNVPGHQQWLDSEWSHYVPGGNCRRLITTREPHLHGLKMIPIERLPRDKGMDLLAKYRKDAKLSNHKGIVGDIVDWFDGWAVGLVVVGVYMASYPDLTWASYANSLDKKGLGAVRDTVQSVGGLPNYDKRVDLAFDDLFQSLPAHERRALDYSALLPADNVLRLWLNWLLASDPNITLPARPGFEDNPSGAVLSDLERGLLRPLAESEGVLTLHRVLRESVRERLQAQPALLHELLDRIVAMMQSRGAVWRTLLRPELSSLFALSEELRLHDRRERILAVAYDELGAASLRRGDLGGATRYFQQAYKLNEAAAADPSDDGSPKRKREVTQAQRDLFISYNKLGDVLLQSGQVTEALCQYQKGLEISQKLAADDPSDDGSPKRKREVAQAQRDLSVSYNKLGDVLLQSGQVTEALDSYQKDLEISQKLAAADPSDAQAQRDVAVSYERLGEIEMQRGNLVEARKWFDEELLIAERRMKLDPADADAQRFTSVVYNFLGDVLLQSGQVTEALGQYQKGLEISQKLAAADPSDAQAQNDLSISLERLGAVSQQLGKLDDARTYFERKREIDERLVQLDPGNAKFQRDLSIAYNKLGDVLLQSGQVTEALGQHQKGLEIRQKLAAADPSDAQAQLDLYVSHHKIAEVQQKQKQYNQAIESYGNGLKILQSLKEQGRLVPANEEWIGIVEQAIAECRKLMDEANK